MTAYAAVGSWLEGLRKHWGGDPAHDGSDRLEILAAFCRFVDRDPDTIIEECVIVKESGKRIRASARRRYAEAIATFQAQVKGSRLERARRGNTVRSFLIHNGVLLQSGLHGGEGSRPDAGGAGSQ